MPTAGDNRVYRPELSLRPRQGGPRPTATRCGQAGPGKDRDGPSRAPPCSEGLERPQLWRDRDRARGVSRVVTRPWSDPGRQRRHRSGPGPLPGMEGKARGVKGQVWGGRGAPHSPSWPASTPPAQPPWRRRRRRPSASCFRPQPPASGGGAGRAPARAAAAAHWLFPSSEAAARQ